MLILSAGAASPGVVTLDANATLTSGSLASPVTNNGLTIGSGSNRVLVGVAAFYNTPTGPVTMTWNGVSMTQIGTAINNGAIILYLFGLVNPASGNHPLVLSWASAVNIFLDLNGTSFTGCNQTGGTTTFVNFSSLTGSGNPTTLSVTTPANDLAVDAIIAASVAPTTPTQTALFDDTTSAFAGSSYGSSGSFGWSVTSGPWAHVGIAIAHV
jgi:hypothetical protein